MELWGGVECTVNRVEDTWFDQLERSGHRNRCASDLESILTTGIRTLRIGLHWERAERPGAWEEYDRLMSCMERLGMTPIAGLVHHGSGPASTNLLDPEFPEKLAGYALKVATRYPQVSDYTPVNEPQTTARFSTLYGYWYPHHRSMRSYVRAMFHQMKGIVLSMQAIRTIQPDARLVHTADGGETFATPQFEQYRIEREHRRWLGVDLLCGRVDAAHPLYGFLLEHGLSKDELLWFVHNRCPPSIVGLNYYVTSDRFLDHRVHLYPGRSGGDSGSEPLVDVEAVRVRAEGIAGIGSALKAAWDRYGIPVAVTEAHLGCDPLQQMRWLHEIWREASLARTLGVDVRAVTAWALLGSYNWCHLCTRDAGNYEPGVFDVSSGSAVPTPLAELARRLTLGVAPKRAVQQPGWWHHQNRLTVEPWQDEQAAAAPDQQSAVPEMVCAD